MTKHQTRSQTQAHNNLVSEPIQDMTEQRLERIEKELGALSSMEERILKRMEEMLAAKPNTNQQTQGDHQEGEGSSARNRVKGLHEQNLVRLCPSSPNSIFPVIMARKIQLVGYVERNNSSSIRIQQRRRKYH